MYYKQRKALRALNPDVVDKAIELLKSKETIFSCFALDMGESGYNSFRANWMDGDYVISYRKFVFGLFGFPPNWWNKPTPECIPFRIEALQEFKQAILKAQEPTLWERFKAYVTQPCTVGDY